jgi:hypothetical protein
LRASGDAVRPYPGVHQVFGAAELVDDLGKGAALVRVAHAQPRRVPKLRDAGRRRLAHRHRSTGSLALTISTRAVDPLAGPATFGYYHHSARAIWVRPDRGRAGMAAIPMHQSAHAVTGEASVTMRRELPVVVAKSVAYVAGSRFGLDLALRSTTYVPFWLDNPEAFRAVGPQSTAPRRP